MCIECILTDQITQRLPTVKINRSTIHIPKNIKLADSNFHKPAEVDILIGAESFWRSLCVGQLKPCQGHPTIQKTRFGWVLGGFSKQSINTNNFTVKTFYASISNVELQDQLSKFWQLEEISINDNNTYSLIEQCCENQFVQNVKQNS